MILRHEFNMLNAPLVLNSVTQVNSNESVSYNSSYYSGTISAYLEIEATNTNTVDDAPIRIVKGGTSTGDFASIPANTTTPTLFRYSLASIPFTSSYYQIQIRPLVWTNGTVTIKAARIILLQDTGLSPLTASSSQFEIGSNEAGFAAASMTPSAKPKYWRYVASNWGGTLSFYWRVSLFSGGSMITMKIGIQESSDLSTWATVGTEQSSASTGQTDVGPFQFLPKDGYYYRIAAYSGSTKTTVNLYCAQIIVLQTGTDITKGDDEYLVANNTLASSTSLQNFLTKWDPAEWSGVDIVCKHQTDSNSTSMTAEIDTVSGSQVSGSQVTGTALVKLSSAMTMPGSATNLDVKATTNSNAIYASRIIVSWSKTTAPPATYTPYSFCFIV